MKQANSLFDFHQVMDDKARLNQFVLDPDQQQVIACLDALMKRSLSPPKKFFRKETLPKSGVYVWGTVGRGKSFIVDSFFSAVPVKNKIRVHFHDFLRELHRHINRPHTGENTLDAALNAQLGHCELLCFDELHLHDVGDAMLVKSLLELIVKRRIILVATSNYPPDQLLSNPLYHSRFASSIELIKQYMQVVALGGTLDYRTLGGNTFTPFSKGAYLCPGTEAQRRDCVLPLLPVSDPLPLRVGHRHINVLSASENFLHLTFEALCAAPTAVMDYLSLCEHYRCWIIEGVPKLENSSPAVQQRFINVIDVLYDQHCRLFLISDYALHKMTEGVQQEDIQRTRSRLQQLKYLVLQ